MKKNFSPKKFGLWLGIVLIGVWFAGSYHIVFGVNTNTRVVKKISFSLNEILINMDELKATTAFLLSVRYPLHLQSPN
jgi:hypothetical protein